MSRKDWNKVGEIYKRPWGMYKTLNIGRMYQVKVLTVNPGARLSLQKHFRRSEYWTMVTGQLKVTVNDQIKTYVVGDMIEIPKEAIHRAQNETKEPATFIEVQIGDYLSEDDIVRLEDDYGRNTLNSH